MLELLISFEWDDGNLHKNRRKHGISVEEAEEIFVNNPFIMMDDYKHSTIEKRYHALGITNEGKKLSVCFTIRKQSIRIISARAMSRKESSIYAKTEN
ncbi:MAG: BrnT family toxin [Rickettsiales bacterium]